MLKSILQNKKLLITGNFETMINCIRGILLGALLFMIIPSVDAQSFVYSEGNKPAADKIIAIIGSKIILKSDLQKSILQQKRQHDSLPPNLNCAILEQMLAQNALVLQAQEDSLPVGDERVEQELDRRIAGFERMYGSREKMEEVLGKSIYQIKDEYRDDIKEQLLAQAMRQKIIDQVKITPTEVKAFFDAIPEDSIPYFKSEVEVGQIVIKPDPDTAVVSYTMRQLRDLKKQALSENKSFSTLANLYSDDAASGGDILTLDRTQKKFDPNFVAAAFRLKDGQISPVIKTQFGYHIIQMVHRKGNIAQVRHILKIPPITSSDIKHATVELDSIRKQIVSGELTFGEAASLFSDDDGYYGTKSTGGMFTDPQDQSTFMSVDQLPDPSIVLALDTLDVGQISAPVDFAPNPRMPNQKAVRLIYLKSRSEPHRESLETDYSRVQQQALQKKQMEDLNNWFNEHISDFYLKIDADYNNCVNIHNWVEASQKLQQETGAIIKDSNQTTKEED